MSKIVIIGNSQASVSAIETLRANGFDGEITLLCAQGILPYNQDVLSSWIAKDIKESQVYFKLDKFYQQHKVTLIGNETITRVSTKRHQITLENKTHIAFDKLLITDAPAVIYPSIKGHQKEGVANPFLMSSVKQMFNNIHEIDHAVIKVTNLYGFNMACALSRLEKDVVMLAPKEGLLSEIFDEETSMLLKQIVEAKGIRVIYDDIEEILGDIAVKAVRLDSSKVMAAELVIFDDVRADMRIIQDADMESEGVFQAGTVVNGFNVSCEELNMQGKDIALMMLDPQAKTQERGLVVHDFGVKVCEGFYGGHVRLPEGGREHMKFDGPTNIFKKIYLINDQLYGAVWINALADKNRVVAALAQKQTLPAGNEDQFL